MFHIIIGFATNGKDSPAESLYAGHDFDQAVAAVNSNLPRFTVIRHYKNPVWAKRYNKGDYAPAVETPAVEEAPAVETPAVEEAPPGETPAVEEAKPSGKKTR